MFETLDPAARAQSQDRVPVDQPEVLFVCVHNAGRSQMAAGLLKLRSNGRIHVRSAGSAPSEEINPAVIEAMQEVGVDMSEEFLWSGVAKTPHRQSRLKAVDGWTAGATIPARVS